MNQRGWQHFLQLCLAAETEESLTEVLTLILTPEEKTDIETRCLIIKALLEQQQPQRQISDELHVSIAKITRGSNELKRISQKLKAYLKKNLGLVDN